MQSTLHCLGVGMVLLSLARSALSFSHGASRASCQGMIPGHIRAQPLDPQHSHVTLRTSASSYLPGQLVTVMVRSSRDFMGFLLQARTVEGTGGGAGVGVRARTGAGVGSTRLGPVLVGGSWTLEPPGTHTLHCLSEGDTLTHSDKQLKRNLSFVWRAPDAPMGDIRFYITVVQSYFVYWAGIGSPVVHDGTRTPQSQGNSTGVDGGNSIFAPQEDEVTALPGIFIYALFQVPNLFNKPHSPVQISYPSVLSPAEYNFIPKSGPPFFSKACPKLSQLKLRVKIAFPRQTSPSLIHHPNHGPSPIPKLVHCRHTPLHWGSSSSSNVLSTSLVSSQSTSPHPEPSPAPRRSLYHRLTSTSSSVPSQQLTLGQRLLIQNQIASSGPETILNLPTPRTVVHPNPEAHPNLDPNFKLNFDHKLKPNLPNTDSKPKHPSNPSETPDKGGKYPDIIPRHSAWELGMLLGCSAGLGMVLVVGIRYMYRQACGKRTEVTLNDREREYGRGERGLIHVQECGDLVRVRRIRENSFVLLAEYDILTPPGD
ncbi:reelin domain-containing protein 1-like [Chaetodon trifascialis]|uniref:reelin domain-containing protein 1-like n=1 Tax=Chaetodon trifascialis TaxID=109706 RepID=UPI0039924207